MANKALGRDLGDLLSRARPSRLVARITAGLNPNAASAQAGADPDAPQPPPPAPVPLDLPLPFSPPQPDPDLPASPSLSPHPGATPLPGASPFPLPPSSASPTGPSPIHPANPYTPLPPAPTPLASYILIALDLALLGVAAALAFTDVVPRPINTALAILAVILGAACGCLGYLLRPVRPAHVDSSKVRVQLRRV